MRKVTIKKDNEILRVSKDIAKSLVENDGYHYVPKRVYKRIK